MASSTSAASLAIEKYRVMLLITIGSFFVVIGFSVAMCCSFPIGETTSYY
jgi:hypothetical protein